MNKKIFDLIEEKKFGLLKQELIEIIPVDIAEIIDELDKKNSTILFRLLQKDKAADVFSHLNSQQRKDIVAAIHETQLNEILEELFFDDKIDFLEESTKLMSVLDFENILKEHKIYKKFKTLIEI